MRCKMNNCLKILIYFILSILQCEAIETTENPVVKLEYGKDTNDIYYVELNKSLQIIIENSQAGYVRCYSVYSGTTFSIEEFPNYNENSVINIPSVTPEMSTRWKCEIYQKFHGPPQIEYNFEPHTVVAFHFRLYVKGARSVNVSINGEFLNFTKMGLNVKHDGEAFYNFIDHQNIELVCADVDKQSEVSLEYFNQNGEKIFEIPQERDTSILLRTRLTSKQEKFHIDCIAHTTSPRREYRYRIYFYKKELEYNPDNQDNVFIVTVNGLLERYVRRNGSYFDYPPFKYIDGEIITVSCETKLKYPLQFYFGAHDDSTGIKVKRVDQKIVAIINSSAVLLNKKTLSCGFDNTNRNVKNVFARMTFESDIADRAVRVFGLHRPNILYEYLRGNIWTTVYQYSVDEIISLGCVLNILPEENYKFEWIVNGVASNKFGYRDKFLSGMKYSVENITKRLTENYDKKVIKCIAYKNSNMFDFAQVKLQLKDTSNSENLEADTNTYKTIPLILLYLAVCVAFITIMIYSLIFWRKRARMARLLNNPYDNISNQNVSPIPPFPPQWDENDHYTKIDEGVMQENYSYGNNNKMPKYPNLRQSHAPSENHYTEIDDYFKTPHKSASKNVYQDINVNKTINLNDNKDTYDKLRRDDKLIKQNTDKPGIYEAVHEKHNKADQQNLEDYKNINAMTTINDSAYAYAYDTRPVDAKCRNKDKRALDYDVPYSISDVTRENEFYVGPDTPKT